MGPEFGAILPNQQPSPMQTYEHLANQHYQMQQQKQQQELGMAKWMADKLDMSNYATGDVTDPLINASLADSMKRNAQDLKNGVPMSQIIFNVANDASKLSRYSSLIKNVDAQAKQYASQFAKDPSVDANQLYKYYKIEALHDGNGGIKPLDQINPDQNYGDIAMQKYGDQIVKGPGAIDAFVKAQEKKTVNPEDTVTVNGVKRKVGYNMEYYPSLNEVLDAKGNVVTDPTKQIPAGLRLKSKTVVLPNGNKMEVADDGVYSQISQNRGANAYLDVMARHMGIDPDTPQGQLVKQKLLHDYLSQKGIGYMMKTKDDVDDSQLERENFTRSMKYLSQAFKEKNKDSKIQDNPLFGIISGMEGNPNYRSADPVDWDGTKVYDFTPFVKGAAVYSGKNVLKPDGTADKQAYAGVGQSANSGNLIVRKVDAQDKKTKELYYANEEVEPKKEFDWFKKVGAANGMSTPEISELYNETLGKTVNQRQAEFEKKFPVAHQTDGAGPFFGLTEQAAPVEPTTKNNWLNKIRFTKKR